VPCLDLERSDNQMVWIVVLNRGSKKDVRVESKQSTLSFTTSRRNSTTTSMADDDVVKVGSSQDCSAPSLTSRVRR